MALRPIVNAGEKYIYGLNISRTDDEVVAISAGAARDSTNVWDIEVSAALAVDNLVSGANGLDTGSVAASTMYALYVIGDSTRHNSAAGLMSLSFSDPTLPSGYDVFRRVGAVLTDGSSDNLEFYQFGDGHNRWYYYDVGISELSGGSAATFTAVDLATSVPPVACNVLFDVAYTPNGATDKAEFLPFASSASNGMMRFGYGVAAAQVGMLVVPCTLDSGVPKIKYKVTSGDTLTLLAMGYEDIL